jgi:hypothetical protein
VADDLLELDDMAAGLDKIEETSQSSRFATGCFFLFRQPFWRHASYPAIAEVSATPFGSVSAMKRWSVQLKPRSCARMSAASRTCSKTSAPTRR